MSQKTAKQITLRGLPPETFHILKVEAKRQKKSLNRFLLSRLLPETQSREEGACADLLKLAGTWDKERAKDFEKYLEGHRQVDAELWS